MAGTDTGHHQNQAGAEMLEQILRRHTGGNQLFQFLDVSEFFVHTKILSPWLKTKILTACYMHALLAEASSPPFRSPDFETQTSSSKQTTLLFMEFYQRQQIPEKVIQVIRYLVKRQYMYI